MISKIKELFRGRRGALVAQYEAEFAPTTQAFLPHIDWRINYEKHQLEWNKSLRSKRYHDQPETPGPHGSWCGCAQCAGA